MHDAPHHATQAHALTPEDATWMRRATVASTSVAILLVVVKSIAYFATGSVALLSSLIDSLLDLLASAVTFLAVRRALTPADRMHRFGHGKAEPLSALAQGAFIIGSAMFLSAEALSRLGEPEPISQTELGIAVMVFSILATLALVMFQRWVVRRTRSIAVTADSLHYTGDLLMNLAVIAALVLVSEFQFTQADPLFALAIAAYLIWNGIKIAIGAIDVLMDKELPVEDRDRIKAIALAIPDVKGLHDLRTRSSGVQQFIQMHLVLDGDLALWDAHRIADDVEAALQDAFPNADIIVHQDPEGLAEHHPPVGAHLKAN